MTAGVAMFLAALGMSVLATFEPLSPGRCFLFGLGCLIGGAILDGTERVWKRYRISIERRTP